MKESPFDKLVIVCTLIFFVLRGIFWQRWEFVAPLVWAICAVVLVHAVIAALKVSAEIGKEAVQPATEIRSSILTPSGEPVRINIAHETPRAYKLQLLAAVILVAGLCGWASFAAWTKGNGDVSAEQRPPQPIQPPSPPDPIIESSIELEGTLPIATQPGHKTFLFVMRDDRKLSPEEIVNTGEDTMFWPATRKKLKALGLRLYPEYRTLHLSNHSGSQVFSIVSRLKVDFYPPGTPVDYTGKNPTSSDSREFEIDTIQAGGSRDILILNESHYCVLIELPDSGALEVQGDATRRSLRFLQKTDTVADRVQQFAFPTFFTWQGDLPVKDSAQRIRSKAASKAEKGR